MISRDKKQIREVVQGKEEKSHKKQEEQGWSS